MTPTVAAALVVVAAYLSGSVPYGYLIARRRGIDIQAAGSGNIGATNVARILGKKTGALVLLLDALKGALPVLLALWVAAGDTRGTRRSGECSASTRQKSDTPGARGS